MQQLQHYNFGWQISNLTYSEMPLKRDYTAFFCSDSAHQLRNQPEEIIFGCFVTTLNDAFEQELAQEDEGYWSGSETLSIPTPLRRAPLIYHISTSENISFDPTMPLTTAAQHCEHSSAAPYATICCIAVLMKRAL